MGVKSTFDFLGCCLQYVQRVLKFNLKPQLSETQVRGIRYLALGNGFKELVRS